MSERPENDTIGSRLSTLQSSQSKLVYLALATSSGSTIEELLTSLRLPALSLYPTLDLLIKRDFVERRGEVYVSIGRDEN